MSERIRRTLLNFPVAPRGAGDRDAPGELPESAPDELLLHDLAAWTVPPASDESRERLLADVRVELEKRARAARQQQPLRMRLPASSHRRWSLMAMASTLVAAVAASFLWGVVTVSADEALSRAQNAETRQWTSISRPLVHQRIVLRVAKRSERREVRWESWSQSDGNVHHFRTEPASQREIVGRYLEALARNGLDKGPPLSAVAFVRWREQLPADDDRTERVEHETTEMGPALRIHVQWPGTQIPGRIVDASVLLRTSDWHAIEQVLHVRTSDGDLERFDVIERHAAVVSQDHVPSPAVDEPAAAPASKVHIAPTPAPVPAADLHEVEIQALFALHQLHADLGEQIEVVRRPQYVEIHGVVDTADRVTAITGVVSQIPHTRVSVVQATRGVPIRPAAQPPASSSRSGPEASIPVNAASEPPLWRFVEAYLRTTQADESAAAGDTTARARAVNVFVQEVNGEAEAAVAEAWALRRLNERYPSETRDALAEPSRRRLQEMTHDHLAAIRGRIVCLRRALAPVEAAARSARDAAAVPDSQTATDESHLSGPQVFLAVIGVERRLAELVLSDPRGALAGDDDEAVLRALARLLASLTRLDHDLQLLAEQG